MDPQDPADDVAGPADDAPGEPDPSPDAGDGEATPVRRPSWEPL